MGRDQRLGRRGRWGQNTQGLQRLDPRLRVWDLVWLCWAVRGECLADKRRIWVFKVLEKRFRLEAGAGQ